MAAATIGHLHFDMDKKVMALTLNVQDGCEGVRGERGCGSAFAAGRGRCPARFAVPEIISPSCAFWCASAGGSPPVSHEQWRCSYLSQGGRNHRALRAAAGVANDPTTRQPSVRGARYMASLGIDFLIIQLLGCWGSDAALRYVAEVPLSALTESVINCIQTACVKEVSQGEQLSLTGKSKGLDIDGDMISNKNCEKDQLTSIRRRSEGFKRGPYPDFVLRSYLDVEHSLRVGLCQSEGPGSPYRP